MAGIGIERDRWWGKFQTRAGAGFCSIRLTFAALMTKVA